MREDTTIIVRDLRNRFVETLLLVVGIALGVGATTAGVGVWAGSLSIQEELRNEPVYREIVVRSAESSDQQDTPAVAVSDDTVWLDATDLEARDLSPDVAYAYLMNRTEMRFVTSEGLIRMPGMEEPPETAETVGAPENTPQPEKAPGTDEPIPGTGSTSSADEAETAGPEGDTAPPSEFDERRAAMAEAIAAAEEIGNPLPAIEDAEGYAVSEEFFAAYGLEAVQGSVFTASDVDSGANYIVLGATLGSSLFEDGESLGRTVIGNFEQYTIIGVLEETGTSLDGKLLTPAEIAGAGGFRGFGPPQETTLRFMVGDADRLAQAQQQLTSYFEQEYGTGLVSVENSRDEYLYVQDRNARIVSVVVFLSVIGLLIAAVNVSNILFTRMMKKRRDAGVLKALGATQRSVFRTFLLEGMIIGILGAVVGAGLSIALSRLFVSVMGLGTVSIGGFVVGILGSVLLTLSFMVSPAAQVSRVSPVDAIRYE